jgi:hypothetical protein
MKNLMLIGSAIVALVLIPIFGSAASAQSRANVGSNYGYCKSGAKVSDLKSCKENGGNQ